MCARARALWLWMMEPLSYTVSSYASVVSDPVREYKYQYEILNP